MSIYDRVAFRFHNRRAMSLAEAKQILGFPPSATPSDDEVNRAYRQRFIDDRRLHPDTGGDPEKVRDLNVAKDVLQGKLRPDRGGPSVQQERQRQQDEEEYRRKRDKQKEADAIPVDDPPGEPFNSALRSAGSVEWKIISNRDATSRDYIVDGDHEGTVYGHWETVSTWVLIGETASSYVVAQLRSVEYARGHGGKNSKIAWSLVAMPVNKKVDFLKAGPKAVKSMLEGMRGRPKFMVLDGGPPNETTVLKSRASLSFKDAVIGAGLSSEGAATRKIQVEVEPILNMDRYRSKPRADWNREGWEQAYDWFVSINGKRAQLKTEEVERLKKNLFFFAVWSYDYDKGKKNITKLRGSGRLGIKPGAKDSLTLLAQGLNSGPVKDAVLRAAERV